MTTIKTIALSFLATTFTFNSIGQTVTKTTTTVTAAKQAVTTTATKKKTTTKVAPKSTVVKTTTTVAKQTQTNTPRTLPGLIPQTKTVTPVPVFEKAETPIVIPQAQVQTQTTKGQTNTNTNPTPTPQTGGKINTGGKIINGGTDNGNNNNSIINDITNGDATSAIKEALIKGVQTGVDKVSMTDGYLGNSLIKIPFPSQVSQVEDALRNFGMGSLIDNAVTSMNRAAESAASQAGPIFLNGIKQMNVTDAVNLVTSKQPDAATQFLQRTTSEGLVTAFKPSIKTALDKTLATKYWGDIVGTYNKIPFVSPINTDLPDYVTRKAIDGLFIMVAQEEAKIRKDPGGQANDIIKTVFGKAKF